MTNLPIVVFEIGLNGNGQVQLVKDTIDIVIGYIGHYPKELLYFKFQKREPDVSTPKHMWNTSRISPKSGNEMSYLDYRKEMEFSTRDYMEIASHVRRYLAHNHWFVSVWDIDSIYWVQHHFPNMPYVKVPSAHMTNNRLVEAVCGITDNVMISTGGATEAQIKTMTGIVPDSKKLTLLSCTSTYPTPDGEVNLYKMIAIKNLIVNSFHKEYHVGFSSHSSGILPILMAGVLGAEVIEFHVTSDRTLPGSDHAASIEGGRIGLIMRELARIPNILGNGKIGPSDSELAKLDTLR